MSRHDNNKLSSGRILFLGMLLVFILVLLPSFVLAQDEPTPKIEIFTGYQWLNPGGTVPQAGPVNQPTLPDGVNLFSRGAASPAAFFVNPVGQSFPSLSKGLGVSATYNFIHWLGLEADFGHNFGDPGSETTFSIGPRAIWRQEHVNLFAHTLLGLNRLSPDGLPSDNKIGAILGGGMDIKVIRLLSIRVIEADYVWSQHNFSSVVSPQFPDLRRPTFGGARLRSGVVWNLDYPEAKALPTASCSVQPGEVLVGEPITATATGSNFNPKHVLTYSWTSTGGKVTGKDSTASIDTNGVAGGSYTVTAHIADAKMKKNGEVTCSAPFKVKEPPKNPPTVACTVNPTTVQIGANANVSCPCTSPDNVPVTVAGWTASGGSISGSGSTATLSTTGAAAGPVTVSATCTDSRGLNTSASAQVTLETPPPSPEIKRLETRLALHSIYFPTAQPTAKDPTGGLLASQQQTLLTLASDFQKYLEFKPDARLILEGHTDPRGSVEYNQSLSERRVERARSFLVEHNVPAANIDIKAYGKQKNLTDVQVKDAVEQNSELTPQERQRILKNMRTIILASNRRVDVTLSTTGETSVRQFPFNAADSLTLIKAEGARTTAPGAKKPVVKKSAKPAAKP